MKNYEQPEIILFDLQEDTVLSTSGDVDPDLGGDKLIPDTSW